MATGFSIRFSWIELTQVTIAIADQLGVVHVHSNRAADQSPERFFQLNGGRCQFRCLDVEVSCTSVLRGWRIGQAHVLIGGNPIGDIEENPRQFLDAFSGTKSGGFLLEDFLRFAVAFQFHQQLAALQSGLVQPGAIWIRVFKGFQGFDGRFNLIGSLQQRGAEPEPVVATTGLFLIELLEPLEPLLDGTFQQCCSQWSRQRHSRDLEGIFRLGNRIIRSGGCADPGGQSQPSDEQ